LSGVTTDTPIREELERFAREMRLQKKRAERRRKVAEARGRIIVMLMGLARYEPQYEGVRAFVEEQWQSAL